MSAILATAIFVGWEATAAIAFGHSPLLFAAQYHFVYKFSKILLLESLLCSWPIVSPAHLGWGVFSRRWKLGLVLAVAGLAGVEIGLGLPSRPGRWALMAVGLLIAGYVCIASGSILQRRRRRSDRLLLFWLFLEFASVLFVSPFAAARRLAGVLITSTLVLGEILRFCTVIKASRAKHSMVFGGRQRGGWDDVVRNRLARSRCCAYGRGSNRRCDSERGSQCGDLL